MRTKLPSRLTRLCLLLMAFGLTTTAVAQNVQLARSSVKFTPGMTGGTLTGTEVDLIAARNEFEAFQVLVTAPATSDVFELKFRALELELVLPGGGTNPNVFIPPENVRIYRLKTVEVLQRSNDESPGPGFYPDPLVPYQEFEKGPAMDNSTGAWIEMPWVTEERERPIDIAQGNREIWWVEILVPKTQKPGNYRGTLNVEWIGGNQAVTVNLEVLPIPALPSTSVHPTLFTVSPDQICRAHGDVNAGNFCDGEGIWRWSKLYGRFLLDHRLTVQFSSPESNPLPANAKTRFSDYYGQLIGGGEPYSRLVGAQVTALDYPWWLSERDPVNPNGPPLAPISANTERFITWQDFVHGEFSEQYHRALDYNRHADEPANTSNNPNGWYFVQRLAEVSKDAATATQKPRIPNLVTTSIQDYLGKFTLADDYINIITPVLDHMDHPSSTSSYFGNQRQAYEQFEKQNAALNRVWGYQSCDQHGCGGGGMNDWPNLMIDATGVQNRAEPWLHFIYGLEGMLYYEIAQELPTAWDPGGQWAYTGNGDGTLVYPGTPAYVGGSTHIPVASYRLKMLREGMEDYEYLYMCAQKDPVRAKDIASSLFPHTNGSSGAMYNVNNHVSGDPNRDPVGLTDLLEVARRELAVCIGSGEPVRLDWSDSTFVSPPKVKGPVRTCSGATPTVEPVTIEGVIKNANVDVYRITPPGQPHDLLGSAVAAADGLVVINVSVVIGDDIYAVQTMGGSSAKSNVVEVGSFSLTTPTPKMVRPTYYECERATLGDNLVPGRQVRVKQGSTILSSNTPASTGILFGFTYSQGLVAGTNVVMEQAVCGYAPATDSHPVIPLPSPPLPAPSLSDCEVYGKPETCVQASGLEPGALLTVVAQTSPQQVVQTEIFSETEQVMLSIPPGTSVEVYQQLCLQHGFQGSEHTPTNLPCEAMPPPRIETPFEGQKWVRVIDRVKGSRVQVFGGTPQGPVEEIGDSTLEVIFLKRGVRSTETLWVVQSTAECRGENSYPVTPTPRGEGG